jgi:hypothetical protein
MRRVILAIVTTAAALVLLLSFKTHTQPAVPGNSPASVIGSPTPGGTGSAGAASPAGSSPAGGGVTRTVTGKAFSTIYGPVQVQITVADGRIAKARATSRSTPSRSRSSTRRRWRRAARRSTRSPVPRTPRAATSARCRTPWTS